MALRTVSLVADLIPGLDDLPRSSTRNEGRIIPMTFFSYML